MSVRRTMPDGPPSRIPRLKSGRRKGARAARGDLSYECAGKVGDRRRCRPPPGGAKGSELPLGTAAREFDGRRLDSFHGPESHSVVLDVDDHGLAGVEFLPQDPLRERILHQALDGPAEGPGPEGGVVALGGEVVLGGGGELEAETLALQLLP